MTDIVERLRARADALERLGQENRPLTSEGDVAICVLTREHLRQAADRIEQLTRTLEEARDGLNAMMEAWFDYHDAHSLTQPVTGAAGNAFDRALAAREGIDTALGHRDG